jgi:hypothetical protein
MTIERPMFPPRADACQIIDFSSIATAKIAKEANALGRWLQSASQSRIEGCADAFTDYLTEKRAKRAAKLLEVTTEPEKFSETCRNHRFRLSRRDAWWAASHLTDYWRVRLDWQSALSTAQTHDVADANSHPKCEERLALVDQWRAAVLKQMLTPAPDQNAVNWKLAKLRGRHRNFDFTDDVKPERLQRAIDADVEWLKAHPSRKSIAASRQADKGE